MEVKTIGQEKITPHTAAAIGFFDGIHKAHQSLIKQMIKEADKRGLNKAIITFDKHPKHVLFDMDYYYITPLEEKIKQLKAYPIDTVYVIEFDKEKASMNPRAFIQDVLNPLDVLVCGFDFTFGFRASGNVDLLKNHGDFETIIVDELKYCGYKIGSTHIRDLIRGGHVDEIKPILGDYYRLKGTVIHGKKKGRTIAYPTANIDVKQYLIPKKGVYATLSKVKGQWYRSMTSVGFNPTLNRSTSISVESYLFDFADTIYGEAIELVFIKRLRDEKKFPSVQALIDAIKNDETKTLKVLKGVKIDGRDV